MAMAPDTIHTMVVSGDVFIRATQPLQPVPDADVVCYGLWLPASTAKNHGVFVSSRQTPTVLKQMLQKPSVQTLGELQKEHFYLTDIGVWMLSDKAVKLLMKKTKTDDNAQFKDYDLYGQFGCTLGTDPTIDDPELRELKVAILPLPGGEFYHFGTSREMISSTLAVQNLVKDQREIMHLDRKPHPSIFVQNAVTEIAFTEDNTNIWIENSYVPKSWHLTHDHVITGVPRYVVTISTMLSTATNWLSGPTCNASLPSGGSSANRTGRHWLPTGSTPCSTSSISTMLPRSSGRNRFPYRHPCLLMHH